MSIFDRLLDLLPMSRVRPERWPPVQIHGSSALDTETELARFLLSRSEVRDLLADNDASVEVLLLQLGSMQVRDRSMTRETVRLLATADRAVASAPIVGTFLHLICMGTEEIRSALTPPGCRAGDIAFRFAHGVSERDLVQRWPTVSEDCSLEVLNDSITPLECAVAGLQEVLDIPYERAARIALQVHGAGTARLPCPGSTPLVEYCLRANAAWRSKGLALYCQPSPHGC